MSEGGSSWFIALLRWVVLAPFKLIGLLFKLKLRHTLVLIYVIVMLVSAFGDAVVHRNIAYFFLGMGRLVLGADQNISQTITTLAEADKVTLAGHSWLIFNMIGSLYLIGYMIYYLHEFFTLFNKDMPPVLTLIIYIIIFFGLKMVYLVWEGQVTQVPYDLSKPASWFEAVPFRFVYDFIVNFDKLYLQVEPAINTVKNLTEPYTGIFNQTKINNTVVANGT